MPHDRREQIVKMDAMVWKVDEIFGNHLQRATEHRVEHFRHAARHGLPAGADDARKQHEHMTFPRLRNPALRQGVARRKAMLFCAIVPRGV